jgi:hypothetical protein
MLEGCYVGSQDAEWIAFQSRIHESRSALRQRYDDMEHE